MPRSPSKTPKMNSVVARALAAMGNEDDDAGGGNEREAKDGRQQLNNEKIMLPIAKNQYAEHSRRLSGLHRGNGSRGGTADMMETEAGQNSVAGQGWDGDISTINGQNLSERLNANDTVRQSTNTLLHLHVLHHDKYSLCRTEAADIPNSTRITAPVHGGGTHQLNKGDSSNSGEEIDEMIDEEYNEIVRPHSRDILPCFLATPFDGNEMLALHRLKEGIESVGTKRKRSMVLDRLPISPQKHFIKKKKVGETCSHSAAAIDSDVDSSLIPDALHSNSPSQNDQQHHSNTTHMIQASNGLHYPQNLAVSAPVLLPGTSMQNCDRNSNQACTSPASPPTPQSILDDPSQPQAAVAETGRSNPHTDSLVVIAGKAVKLDSSNRDQIAKLPVAFGFSLDNGGRSRALALAATQNWYMNGKCAAINDYNRKGISRGKKSATLIGSSNNVSSNGAPKSSPSSNGTKNTAGASSSDRVSATLVSSSDSPPGFPNGWTMKTFKRMSGKTSGTTDSYWYSPQLKYKFRSVKSCNLFIQILNEPGIDGDERVAFNAFKKRSR